MGVMNVPGELSVTVTVQLVAAPMVTGPVHVSEAVTDLPLVTVMLNLASGLAAE